MNRQRYENTAIRLKEALEDAHMSQQELSDKSGVSKSAISHYINGTHCPNNVMAGQLSKVLNVSPVWLMGFDVPKIQTENTNSIDPNSENYVLLKSIREKIEKMNGDQLEQLLKYARFIESEGE